MKFTKTHNDWNGEFLETISMEMREDAHIDDVIETFSRFLKAVGYHFNGELQIVYQEKDPLDDDQDWGFDDDEDDETADVNKMTPAFEGPIEGFQDRYEVNDTNRSSWPFPSNTKP